MAPWTAVGAFCTEESNSRGQHAMSGNKRIRISERRLADFLSGASVDFSTVEEGAGPGHRSSDRTHYIVSDPLEQEVKLTSGHLIRVCNAYLDGKIDEAVVRAVGFLVVGSDAFDFDVATPDGDRVMKVANDWAAPEINFKIDEQNMRKWRAYLQGVAKGPKQ